MIPRRLSVGIIILLVGIFLFPGCSFDEPTYDEGSILGVEAWEGWVKVEARCDQQGIGDERKSTDIFTIEVTLDEQDKYTSSSKWFGESDEGSLWEQSNYEYHREYDTFKLFHKSDGTGTGFGQISLEICEESRQYLIMVGATLEKSSTITRIYPNRPTEIETEVYEHERFEGLWTGKIDLPESGMVLKGSVEQNTGDIQQVIQWELWPKGQGK